jgi:predicted ABC-type ATPase
VAEATGGETTRGNIFVLAGCNGAGKSSIGGEALRQSGVDFFNPDEAAKQIAAANRRRGVVVRQEDINTAAWAHGRRLLLRAIAERGDFAFETTLGGGTMTALLERAAGAGLAVNVWFAGLEGVDLHIDRVRRRVAKGGHDIPVDKIRRRYEDGRVNLVRLLPRLYELYLYDNSREADPGAGIAPVPKLVMRVRHGRIVAPTRLRAMMRATPQWAKPIVAAALKAHAASSR